MIKYRISTYVQNSEIEPIKIIRETKSQVVYKTDFGNGKYREDRAAKKSSYHEWFDTWDEARDRLIEISDYKLKSARFRLREAHDFHRNLKGLKKP